MRHRHSAPARGAVCLFAFICAGASVPAATAQEREDRDVIVVTASKRGLTAADIDGFLAVESADALLARNVRSLDQLDGAVPGLSFKPRGNRGYDNVALRGQSSVDFYSPKVQVYVDGLPQDQASFVQLLPSGLERVEVLYGPQGTLWGRGAVGGVVNVVTRRPGEGPLFSGAAAYGSLERDVSAILDVDLVEDALFADVAAAWQEDEGEYESLATGERLGDAEDVLGRVRLRYAPSGGAWDVELLASREDIRSSEEQYVPAALLEERSAVPVPNDYRLVLNSYGITASLDLGGAVVTSLSSLQDREFDRTVFGIYSPESQTAFTQELRIASAAGEEARFSYVAGAYYEDVEFRFDRPGFGQTALQDIAAWALFGEATWRLTDRLDATAGVRTDWHEVDARGVAAGFDLTGSDSFSAVSPKLALGFQATEATRLYALVSTGYKAGGFTRLVTPAIVSFSYDPEETLNYEAGLRTSFWDGRATLSAAAYFTRTDDYQLFVGTQPNQYLQNVGEAESKGLDVQLEARPTDRLFASLALSLNEAEFTAYDNPVNPGQDLTGNRIPYAPRTTARLDLGYDFALPSGLGTLRPSVNVAYVDELMFDETNAIGEDGYTLLGAAAVWALPSAASFEAYVNNAADETYTVYGFDGGPGLGPLYQVGRGVEGGVRVRAAF